MSIELVSAGAGISCSDGFEAWQHEQRLGWGAAAIKLLKLHGSCSWADADGNPLFLLGGNKLTVDGPYMALLTEFRDALRGIDRLVIIGYSFRDDHVNSLISQELVRANAIGRFPRIDVVDPQLPPVEGIDTPAWARALLGSYDLSRVEQVNHLHLHQVGCAEYLASGHLAAF